MTKKFYIVFAPDLNPIQALICNVPEQSESLAYGRMAFGQNAVLLSCKFNCSIHDCMLHHISNEDANRLLDYDYVIISSDHPISIKEYMDALLQEDYI